MIRHTLLLFIVTATEITGHWETVQVTGMMGQPLSLPCHECRYCSKRSWESMTSGSWEKLPGDGRNFLHMKTLSCNITDEWTFRIMELKWEAGGMYRCRCFIPQLYQKAFTITVQGLQESISVNYMVGKPLDIPCDECSNHENRSWEYIYPRGAKRLATQEVRSLSIDKTQYSITDEWTFRILALTPGDGGQYRCWCFNPRYEKTFTVTIQGAHGELFLVGAIPCTLLTTAVLMTMCMAVYRYKRRNICDKESHARRGLLEPCTSVSVMTQTEADTHITAHAVLASEQPTRAQPDAILPCGVSLDEETNKRSLTYETVPEQDTNYAAITSVFSDITECQNTVTESSKKSVLGTTATYVNTEVEDAVASQDVCIPRSGSME